MILKAMERIKSGKCLHVKDAKKISKKLSQTEVKAIFDGVAGTLLSLHSYENPAAYVYYTKNTLMWLYLLGPGTELSEFTENLVHDPNFLHHITFLLDSIFEIEWDEDGEGEEVFLLALVFLCELGKDITRNIGVQKSPTDTEALDKIHGYLMTLSTSENPSIRLCLIHYFGFQSYHSKDAKSIHNFDKIMNRFGHSALESLMYLIFERATEGIGLGYLNKNLPYFLDSHAQSRAIFHENLKFFMLRFPEKFVFFFQSLSNTVLSYNDMTLIDHYLEHLEALLDLSIELEHTELTKEFLVELFQYHSHPIQQTIIKNCLQNPRLPFYVKEKIQKAREAKSFEKAKEILTKSIKAAKRGRKPLFAFKESNLQVELMTFAKHMPRVRLSL